MTLAATAGDILSHLVTFGIGVVGGFFAHWLAVLKLSREFQDWKRRRDETNAKGREWLEEINAKTEALAKMKQHGLTPQEVLDFGKRIRKKSAQAGAPRDYLACVDSRSIEGFNLPFIPLVWKEMGRPRSDSEIETAIEQLIDIDYYWTLKDWIAAHESGTTPLEPTFYDGFKDTAQEIEQNRGSILGDGSKAFRAMNIGKLEALNWTLGHAAGIDIVTGSWPPEILDAYRKRPIEME